MDTGRFFVWKERVSGGHLNFITGAGGFLQSLIHGYGGLRWRNGRLRTYLQLPPGGATHMTLRGVQYIGGRLDFSVGASGARVTMTKEIDPPPRLLDCLKVADTGSSLYPLCSPGDTVSFPSGKEIAVEYFKVPSPAALHDRSHQGRREVSSPPVRQP